MTECPKLNTLDSQPDIISAANQKQLVLSTYNRTSGTQVSLSCISPFYLNGQSNVECQDDGTWDVDSIPFCGSKAPAEEGLTDETKILIGVLVAVAVFVILVLLCIVCTVRGSAKSRRKKRSANKGAYGNKGYYADEISYVVPPRSIPPPTYRDDSLYRGDNQYRRDDAPFRREEAIYDKNDNNYRQRSTSFDVSYSRPTDQQPTRAQSVTGSLTRGTRGAEMFYIYKGDPDRKRKQAIHHSRDRHISEVERPHSEYDFRSGRGPTRASHPGVSSREAPRGGLNRERIADFLTAEWPSRTDPRDLDEFNTRALFHGRDPFLWKPVDTNWGFHLNR